ncbi:hypothetical protein HDZ31DRAFT_66981 [Schizophyllum fasciatum]
MPGPNGPHRDCINHILDVVVDQFDELYDPGVYISRTARHPHGRRVEAVLKISSNDLPAARQLSGQASHAHTHGCHVCDTPIQDLDNLDMATWHVRNWEEEKQWGLAWKNATSIMEQEEIYELHGLRYSPLQRLPTFDVIMCTVLDTMHMFAEGLIPTHVRKVYGMDRDTMDGAGLATFSGRRSSEEDFSAGFYVLQWGNDSLLTGLKLNVLKDICQDLNLQYGGRNSRKRMVKHLKEYRTRHGWFDGDGRRLRPLPSGLSTDFLDANRRTARGNIPRVLREHILADEGLAEHIFKTRGVHFISRRMSHEALVLMAERMLPSPARGRPQYREMPEKDLRSMVHEKRIAAGYLTSEGKIARNAVQAKRARVKGKSMAKIPAKRRDVKRDSSTAHPPPLAPFQPGLQGSPILGKERLAEIDHDAETLILPSSMQAAPKSAGERKGGKFKAASWLTYALVNLPITLIRLWGSAPSDSRERAMLDNYMHLVKAIRLASLPYMTPEVIESYTSEMHRYLTTLLELFPGTTITIYQHLSLHLPLLLAEHGPTHAWRCWVVERMNHVLQTLNTNNKFGQLETTLFYQFNRDQALRATVRSHMRELRPEMRDIVLSFIESHRNRVNDMDDDVLSRAAAICHDYDYGLLDEVVTWAERDTRPLDPSTYRMLLDWLNRRFSGVARVTVQNRVYHRDKIIRLNETFASTSKTTVDHIVVFEDRRRPPRPESSPARLGLLPHWNVGEIQALFSCAFDVEGEQTAKTFAVLTPYRHLDKNDTAYNNYARYGAAGGDLYYDAVEAPQLLSMDAILGHATRAVVTISGIGDVVHCIPFSQNI